MTGLDLSICIVTLQARDFLRDCLRSIIENTQALSYEIIVADNCSVDGTAEMVATEFKAVCFLRNESNEGFARPMNRALRQAQGRHLLLLNPDTLVLPHALEKLVDFLDNQPQVGLCGPKVLNRDGTLQKQCRRSAAGPWDTFTYMSGLSGLFPKSKRLAGYLMTYMDEDASHPVEALSGSCMLIRREVIDQVGYLDERFFAYQEDADYCFRARQAGWEIFYHPKAQVIHYGGQGGARVYPYRSIFEWHKSYWLYYRKNFARDYFFGFNWLYYSAMGLKLVVALLLNLLRSEKFAGPRRI
jgi:GT2 family glycosyltransferase